MPCYDIDGVTPVADPSAFVHLSAVLFGDVVRHDAPGALPLVVTRTIS